MQSKLLTVNEVSVMLNVCTRTVYRWYARGWVSGFKLPNGRIRVYRRSITNFLKGDV